MHDTPESLERLVREWAAIAQDRELTRAFLELRAHFDRWQRGEISTSDLNELVHKFHEGGPQEIGKTYADDRLEPAVAFAVATGVLRREELPPELLQHVAGLIELYEVEQPG